ncbi:MAG: hypothetical protein IT494_04140 [Gammaproteobacteria bacterium]|nr:hypothetical protein [Gammaproteobacteria bacterium]
MYAGISLQQAPPLSVPGRFFLTAPWFGVAAALLLLFDGEALLASRWSPAMLAATHGLALGFIATIMLGATQQLLPVLASAIIPRPRPVATLIHLLWLPGVALLMAAFLLLRPWLFHAAATLLSAALAIFIGTAGHALYRSESSSDSAAGMRLALLGLLAALTCGVLLAFGLAGTLPLWRPRLTNLHLAFGLIGWIALLLMAVAWQVVPMFQITPPYPAPLRVRAARGLLLLLAGKALALGLSGTAAVVLDQGCNIALAGLLAAFAIATLRLQRQARRKVRDSHRDFWRLGMVGLLLSILCWAVSLVFSHPVLPLLTATLFLLGFALAVITGMLLKIVAFLLWLHLQSLRDALLQAGKEAFSVPKMNAMIPSRHGEWLLRILIAAQIATVVAVLAPRFMAIPAALLWLLHFGYLGSITGYAMYRYHRIRVRVEPHVAAIHAPGTRPRTTASGG